MNQIEIERTNVTPKEFWNYCKKKAESKGLCFPIDDYDEWVNPTRPEKYHTHNHEDWETPQRETIKYMPFDLHVALKNSYNYIIEFEFDTDKKGHGYAYFMEE